MPPPVEELALPVSKSTFQVSEQFLNGTSAYYRLLSNKVGMEVTKSES